MTQNDIEKSLAAYEDLNRTKGTVQFYHRKLRRFYDDLSMDKTIRHGTLQNWPEYQLARYMKEDKPPMLELRFAEYLYLRLTAKVPSEKGNPKSLRKLYLSTKAGIESNIALLVDQAMERMMEQEQFSMRWEEL